MMMKMVMMMMMMMVVVLTKSAHWLQLNREVPPSPVLTCPLHRVLALRLYSIKTLEEVITIKERNCEFMHFFNCSNLCHTLDIGTDNLPIQSQDVDDHRELLLVSGHVNNVIIIKTIMMIMIVKMRIKIITIIPVVTAMPRPQ